MLHTEALFLVNDDQAQVLEHYAVREDAVRADTTSSTAPDAISSVIWRVSFRLLEAGEHANLHGKPEKRSLNVS